MCKKLATTWLTSDRQPRCGTSKKAIEDRKELASSSRSAGKRGGGGAVCATAALLFLGCFGRARVLGRVTVTGLTAGSSGVARTDCGCMGAGICVAGLAVLDRLNRAGTTSRSWRRTRMSAICPRRMCSASRPKRAVCTLRHQCRSSSRPYARCALTAIRPDQSEWRDGQSECERIGIRDRR